MSLVKMFRGSEYRDCVVRECAGSSRAARGRAARPVKKDGASFDLQGVPTPCIVIDCDKPPIDQHATRCDYIFAADGKAAYLAPIEMTSGRKKASVAVSQLQAGADIAAEIIVEARVSSFSPVLVGRLRETRRDVKGLRKIQRERIRFRGRRYPIGSLRSGGRLKDALHVAGN